MKLEEAIRIQTAYIDEGAYEGTDEFMDALRLGIEALKVITAIRERNIVNIHKLLPGETKE